MGRQLRLLGVIGWTTEMPLQTDNLIMVGLGVLGDVPPHPIQPKLPDGVHLRWQPGDGFDFPWHGYFLFRRPHNAGKPICVSTRFDPRWPTGVVANLQLPDGQFSSDASIVLTEGFASANAREIDLNGRAWLRFDLKPGLVARRFLVTLGFDKGRLTEPGGENPQDDDPRYDDPKYDDPKNGNPKGDDPRHDDPGEDILKPAAPPPEEPAKPVELPAGCLGGFLTPILRAFQDLVRAIVEALTALFGQGTDQTSGPDGTQVPDPAGPAIMVMAFDDGVMAAMASASAPAGQTVTVVLEADRMDAVRIEGGHAVLIDICYVPVEQDWNAGWAEIPGFTYPMCLPTAANGYPCPGRPANDAAAEALALQRVRYGSSSAWSGAPVEDLREAMDGMTVNGPGGGPMASRTGAYADQLGGDPDAPDMPDQRPLDLITLGAINPAIAQMAGLYYIDDPEAPAPGPSVGAYDYLLLADHVGLYQGQASAALAALANPLPAEVDGWICFGLRKQSAAPLPVPTEVKAFALPGAATDPALIASDAVHAAGLTWKIEQNADGDLLPNAHVGFHVWRAGEFATQPTGAVAESAHTHITANRMVMVAIPEDGSAVQQYASGWPPYPLHKVDAGLKEGWHAYLVRGMDIFGRISGPSAPASWRQWGPEPDPRPWYYADPPAEAEVNPWAVRLLNKIPPPAVPGVQAWTLDPLDPGLDDGVGGVYNTWEQIGWWNNLPAADKPRLAGLRVRWRWDAEQMAAAPNTTEFRIYVSPGTDPVAGYQDPLNWPARVHVAAANPNLPNYIQVYDDQGVLLGRQYEVLLPLDATASTFPDLVMHPTDATPIVYANVAVTAADNRSHTADDAKWTSGLWGGRIGNEGPIGATAKISRVLRSPPPAPPLIGDDDKVWATRADYHGVSRYTVHWVKPTGAGQKTHIYQCVDDALFRFDHERRKASGATPFTSADIIPFATAGGWDAANQATVLDQLTGLDSVVALDFDPDLDPPPIPNVRAAYGALGERALRVLASFPENADAFVQTTWEPLDPALPENADRAGPDGAATYTPNAAWGAWTAELDGRAANRYFFRYAWVNSAHDVGAMGPSTPAVYLPVVTPARVPAITKVASGQLEITVIWAHNREPNFAEFRLYRADDERQARDRRLMKLVANILREDVDYAQAEVTFTDREGLIRGRTYRYVLTSVDAEGNESLPSEEASAVAADVRPPEPPMWVEKIWLVQNADSSLSAWPADNVIPLGSQPVLRLRWSSAEPHADFAISFRRWGTPHWKDALSGPETLFVTSMASQFEGFHTPGDPAKAYEYRIRTCSSTGVWSADWTLTQVPSAIALQVVE